MTDSEVIEKLREMLRACDIEDNEAHYALNRAIIAVSHMIWTPVKDGIPWRDGEYLVITEDDIGARRMQVSSYWMQESSGAEYDNVVYSWGVETSPIYTVLAWTELPKIWEAENEST